MNDRTRDEIPWVNSNLVTENFNKFPADELLKYSGQWLALSLDGTQILASGADPLEMENRLRQLGINPNRVVEMYLPHPEESVGGGFLDADNE